MQRHIRVVLAAIVIVSALGFSSAAPAAEAPQGRFLVCLDPGHGGSDGGASYNGIQEKEPNLDIALRTRKLLQEKGYAVMMTRETDVYVSLEDRCRMANGAGATIFVSIHNNSYLTTSEGTETYCYYDAADGRRLATSIHNQVVKRLKREDRGVKEAGFYVLKHSDMTSALLEGLFVSNPEEAKMLADPKVRQTIAEGVAAGINDYLMDPGQFDEYILLMNPDREKTASVELDFMRGDGRVQHIYRQLAPGARGTVHVDDYVYANDASTKVFSRNGVQVVAERAMYFDFENGRGGHCAQGVTSPSREFFFAEGSTDWGFNTFILVQNPADEDTRVVMDFLKSDATTVSASFDVAAHSRFTLNASAVEGLAAADFSTAISAEGGVVCERAMYFDRAGTRGGHDSPGILEASALWYMPEGCTRDGFDTYVLLGNPAEQDVAANVSFMLPDGKSVEREYRLPPRSRTNIHLNEIKELAKNDISTVVSSAAPILAERSTYFNYLGTREGTNSTGVTSPSTSWYLSEGYTGDGYDTYILLVNPGDAEADVRITFMPPDGNSREVTAKMPGHSRYTVKVDDVEGLGGTEVSTFVESGQPLVAERAMYFTKGSKAGGHSATGVTGPASEWYFAEGCTR